MENNALRIAYRISPALLLSLGLLLFILSKKNDSVTSSTQVLNEARSLSIQHIKKLKRGTCIIFDFDHTLFDPSIIIGHVYTGRRDFAFGDRRALPLYKPIEQICDVMKYAIKSGMFVVLITARPSSETTRQIIYANLKKQRLSLHALYTNDNYPQNNNFKYHIRTRIGLTRQVGLTIGDKYTDINRAKFFIKLPTKTDPIFNHSLNHTS